MPDELRPAFRTYEDIDPAAPEDDNTLNLAWTRDERGCLAVDLDTLLAHELRDESDRPRVLDRYLVRDPYGEATLGPTVAAAFDTEWQGRITCGAGVVSLIHGLAHLASTATTRIVGDVYPDFPYWVAQHRGDTAIWFLERPSLYGNAFADLAELEQLCDEAARTGAIVIVDESNANYYPPSWSALSIARENLVVIRGFSKAYGLGALRLAFCAAAPALTERIRGVISPLLASSLSLRLGARVLAAGDLAAPLRSRLAIHKREMTQLLERIGIETLLPSEHLPYVLSRQPITQLEARGILGKTHPIWVAKSGSIDHAFRLSIPLSDARMARLRQLLA